jgi:hypothetical protein
MPGQGATARNNSTRLLHVVQIENLKHDKMVSWKEKTHTTLVRTPRAADKRARAAEERVLKRKERG